MKVGQKVEIYEDPLTKQHLEGTARVVEIYKSEAIQLNGEKHTEYHLDVRFEGESAVYFRRYVD